MENLNRQLLDQLRALRSAGVEWLPATGPLEIDRTRAQASTGISTEMSAPREAVTHTTDQICEERRQALSVIAKEASNCTRCTELCSTRTQTVFSAGSPTAEVCFLGEAPGADEDAQGEPFVGEAGKLLNKILAASGFKREEVYICNILKCRPPGNRTPLANEAANCRDFLDRQLEIVAPKYIVALGGCASSNLLGTKLSISRLRGRFHVYRDSKVLVTYHPAYLLPHKDPSKKKEVWEDMKFLLKDMGRPIPS